MGEERRHERPVRALLLLALGLGMLGVPASVAAARERLDLRVFARVPDPGRPEPIAIGPDDGRVYVGTNQQSFGDADAPSRIFAFSSDGRLVRDYMIRGQDLEENHGIQGLAFDGRGRLYALDRAAAPRVVVLDPRSGSQRGYARFRDVPPCDEGRRGDCSATTLDAGSAPNFGAFAPDGTLYVTDIEQALIWRIPPGGGKAEVWFTHPVLESVFGPNGIGFMADGRTLLFASTSRSPGQTPNFTSGALYTLRVRSNGAPGQMKLFWESRPGDGPDGFAIARSGNVYLALAGANQLALISPRGRELARVPADPGENLLMEVPLDGPASVAFLGRRVLFTNQSTSGNPESWAVIDAFAGERGLPLFYPFGDAGRLLRVRIRSRRLRGVRRRGLKLRVAASFPVTVRLRATLRKRGRRVTLARGRVRLRKVGRRRVRLRLTRGGRRTLRGRKRARVTVVARSGGLRDRARRTLRR